MKSACRRAIGTTERLGCQAGEADYTYLIPETVKQVMIGRSLLPGTGKDGTVVSPRGRGEGSG